MLARQRPVLRKLPIAGSVRIPVPASQIHIEASVESSLAPIARSQTAAGTPARIIVPVETISDENIKVSETLPNNRAGARICI